MVSSPNARTLARLLIEQEESRQGDSGPPDTVRLEVCRRLNVALRRTVGSIGCNALFTRALRTAELDAAVLGELSLGMDEQPSERVAEVRAEHGPPALAAALEAFIEILLTLLARFIGEDVVAALTDLDGDPDAAHGNEEEDLA